MNSMRSFPIAQSHPSSAGRNTSTIPDSLSPRKKKTTRLGHPRMIKNFHISIMSSGPRGVPSPSISLTSLRIPSKTGFTIGSKNLQKNLTITEFCTTSRSGGPPPTIAWSGYSISRTRWGLSRRQAKLKSIRKVRSLRRGKRSSSAASTTLTRRRCPAPTCAVSPRDSRKLTSGSGVLEFARPKTAKTGSCQNEASTQPFNLTNRWPQALSPRTKRKNSRNLRPRTRNKATRKVRRTRARRSPRRTSTCRTTRTTTWTRTTTSWCLPRPRIPWCSPLTTLPNTLG